MKIEQAFLEALDLELRVDTREALALYVRGLRTCDGPRTLENLARVVCTDRTNGPGLVSRFHNELSGMPRDDDRWWVSPMMEALARRAVPRLDVTRRRTLLLVAMQAPHVGRTNIARSDEMARTVQIVAALHVVGTGPTGEIEVIPVGWRLAFDAGVWTTERFEQAQVPGALRHVGHVSALATAMLSKLESSDVPELPTALLASGPFAELRFGWLEQARSYVVEWKPPHASASSAHPATPPHIYATTVQADIDQRRGHWKRVLHWPEPELTPLGRAWRTDLTCRHGHVETTIEIADDCWCAHLPNVADDGMTKAVCDFASLREKAKPTYRFDLRRLGLDDYQGTTFAGWHRHRALVSAPHLLERESRWDAAD